MVTITFDELEFNATAAALDLRIKSLSAHLDRVRTQPETTSQRFAVDVLEAAIRHSLAATLTMAMAVDPEASSMSCCGADESTPHWINCSERFTAPVLAGIEQYQAESR